MSWPQECRVRSYIVLRCRLVSVPLWIDGPFGHWRHTYSETSFLHSFEIEIDCERRAPRGLEEGNGWGLDHDHHLIEWRLDGMLINDK